MTGGGASCCRQLSVGTKCASRALYLLRGLVTEGQDYQRHALKTHSGFVSLIVLPLWDLSELGLALSSG